MFRSSKPWFGILGSVGIALAAGLAMFAGASFDAKPAHAAPVTSSGTFDFPMVDQTQLVFDSQVATWAAVSVTVNTGEASVESYDGTWNSLGTVASGRCQTFEGQYTQVRVKSVSLATSGSFEDRSPTNIASADHLVGSGTVSLGSTPVRVYVASAEKSRDILVTAGLENVSIRRTSSGPDLVTIEAGDGTYVHLGDVTEYWLVGGGTATYKVYDDFPVLEGDLQPAEYTVAAKEEKHTRLVTGDGTTCLIVHVTNNKNKACKLYVKYANSETVQEVDLGASASQDVTCHIQTLETDGDVTAKTTK